MGVRVHEAGEDRAAAGVEGELGGLAGELRAVFGLCSGEDDPAVLGAESRVANAENLSLLASPPRRSAQGSRETRGVADLQRRRLLGD
jgi:hypothetical protein